MHRRNRALRPQAPFPPRAARGTLRLSSALAVAAVLAGPPAAAQLEHEDPLGRFAMTLPKGWKLASEQFDLLYQFEQGGTKIIVYVMDGTSDRAKAFRDAVGMFATETPPPPPEGTVYDLVMNGNPARQAQYTFEMASGNKKVPLTAFMGTVTLEGANMSVAFMAILNEQALKKWKDDIPAAFHSIRMRGSSVTGASEPVAVTGALAAAAAEVPASTFEHALVTLDIPAGWTATPGEGPNLATIERQDVAALRVVGAAGNEFGKSPAEAMDAMVAGLQASLPVFNQTRPPREEPTTGGGTVLLAEYEGTLVVQGREVPQWVLVGARKDARGGVGFLWMTPPDKKDAALEQVLAIIRSAR
jgi:hypothetical protein